MMRIVSLKMDLLRATPAIAEFIVRVELDGPARGCEVIGRAVGPTCPGTSTVEVAYPMSLADSGGSAVSLKCVIPEPNLWTPEAQFAYTVSVEVRMKGERTEARTATIALRNLMRPSGTQADVRPNQL